jgi:anti-sigma factor RsiW
MSCLDVDTAVAYLAGELDQLDADRCAAHVAECASCRDLLRDASALIDEVRQDLLVLDGALEDTAPPPIEDIFTRARRSIAVVISLKSTCRQHRLP